MLPRGTFRLVLDIPQLSGAQAQHSFTGKIGPFIGFPQRCLGDIGYLPLLFNDLLRLHPDFVIKPYGGLLIVAVCNILNDAPPKRTLDVGYLEMLGMEHGRFSLSGHTITHFLILLNWLHPATGFQ